MSENLVHVRYVENGMLSSVNGVLMPVHIEFFIPDSYSIREIFLCMTEESIKKCKFYKGELMFNGCAVNASNFDTPIKDLGMIPIPGYAQWLILANEGGSIVPNSNEYVRILNGRLEILV